MKSFVLLRNLIIVTIFTTNHLIMCTFTESKNELKVLLKGKNQMEKNRIITNYYRKTDGKSNEFVEIIRKMPKGALLHIHWNAGLSTSYLNNNFNKKLQEKNNVVEKLIKIRKDIENLVDSVKPRLKTDKNTYESSLINFIRGSLEDIKSLPENHYFNVVNDNKTNKITHNKQWSKMEESKIYLGRFDPVDLTKVLLIELQEDNISYVDLRIPQKTCNLIVKELKTINNIIEFNCIVTVGKKDEVEIQKKVMNQKQIGQDWVGQEDYSNLNMNDIYKKYREVDNQQILEPISIHWGEMIIDEIPITFDLYEHMIGFLNFLQTGKVKRLGHGLLGLYIIDKDNENNQERLMNKAKAYYNNQKDKISENHTLVNMKLDGLKDELEKTQNKMKDIKSEKSKSIENRISKKSNQELDKENIALKDKKINIERLIKYFELLSEISLLEDKKNKTDEENGDIIKKRELTHKTKEYIDEINKTSVLLAEKLNSFDDNFKELYHSIQSYLIEHKSEICYEISPISNDVLGYYEVKNNIALNYFKNGYKMTINSDNNANFDTIGLTHDFISVSIDWDLSADELSTLATNSITCSNASDAVKDKFNTDIKKWLEEVKSLENKVINRKKRKFKRKSLQNKLK